MAQMIVIAGSLMEIREMGLQHSFKRRDRKETSCFGIHFFVRALSSSHAQFMFSEASHRRATTDNVAVSFRRLRLPIKEAITGPTESTLLAL